MSDKIYMFSYGMNTHNASMAVRCPEATCLGAAWLDDHVFMFKYHADVEYEPGSAVEGLLWEMQEEDLDKIDLVEGYPDYYYREIQAVTAQDGQTYHAWVYKMSGDQERYRPSDGYLNTVIQGYNQNGLHTEQVYQALEWCRG